MGFEKILGSEPWTARTVLKHGAEGKGGQAADGLVPGSPWAEPPSLLKLAAYILGENHRIRSSLDGRKTLIGITATPRRRQEADQFARAFLQGLPFDLTRIIDPLRY